MWLKREWRWKGHRVVLTLTGTGLEEHAGGKLEIFVDGSAEPLAVTVEQALGLVDSEEVETQAIGMSAFTRLALEELAEKNLSVTDETSWFWCCKDGVLAQLLRRGGGSTGLRGEWAGMPCRREMQKVSVKGFVECGKPQLRSLSFGCSANSHWKACAALKLIETICHGAMPYVSGGSMEVCKPIDDEMNAGELRKILCDEDHPQHADYVVCQMCNWASHIGAQTVDFGLKHIAAKDNDMAVCYGCGGLMPQTMALFHGFRRALVARWTLDDNGAVVEKRYGREEGQIFYMAPERRMWSNIISIKIAVAMEGLTTLAGPWLEALGEADTVGSTEKKVGTPAQKEQQALALQKRQMLNDTMDKGSYHASSPAPGGTPRDLGSALRHMDEEGGYTEADRESQKTKARTSKEEEAPDANVRSALAESMRAFMEEHLAQEAERGRKEAERELRLREEQREREAFFASEWAKMQEGRGAESRGKQPALSTVEELLGLMRVQPGAATVPAGDEAHQQALQAAEAEVALLKSRLVEKDEETQAWRVTAQQAQAQQAAAPKHGAIPTRLTARMCTLLEPGASGLMEGRTLRKARRGIEGLCEPEFPDKFFFKKSDVGRESNLELASHENYLGGRPNGKGGPGADKGEDARFTDAARVDRSPVSDAARYLGSEKGQTSLWLGDQQVDVRTQKLGSGDFVRMGVELWQRFVEARMGNLLAEVEEEFFDWMRTDKMVREDLPEALILFSLRNLLILKRYEFVVELVAVYTAPLGTMVGALHGQGKSFEEVAVFLDRHLLRAWERTGDLWNGGNKYINMPLYDRKLLERVCLAVNFEDFKVVGFGGSGKLSGPVQDFMIQNSAGAHVEATKDIWARVVAHRGGSEGQGSSGTTGTGLGGDAKVPPKDVPAPKGTEVKKGICSLCGKAVPGQCQGYTAPDYFCANAVSQSCDVCTKQCGRPVKHAWRGPRAWAHNTAQWMAQTHPAKAAMAFKLRAEGNGTADEVFRNNPTLIGLAAADVAGMPARA